MTRQQAGNASSRNVGQNDIGSSDACRKTPAVSDPISQDFVESFSTAAADPKAFDELLTSIFGGDIDQAQAEGFRQSALQGDFSYLPNIEYIGASVLQGGNGAYSVDTNTIYINEELRGTELGAQTFVEEAGHFLDTRLNTGDTRGDEGGLFRRVLAGESLAAEAIDAIRTEDDSGTITINGEQVDVEFRRESRQRYQWYRQFVRERW